MISLQPPSSSSKAAMARNGTSSVKAQKTMNQIASVLTHAICEWFLIFLLLVDAVLSYLVVHFAQHCKLQIPCLLCSRLDHVFSTEKPGFYQTLLCNNHRSDISHLLSCQIHSNLADGRGMCDDCLLSFTKKNKPNPDMHRVLLGKAGFDDLLMKSDFSNASQNAKLCSCCSKPWKSRHNAQRLLQLRLPGKTVSKPNIPVPRRISRRGSLKKMRDKLVIQSDYAEKSSGGDGISCVGYTELKITSDSESEFPFSDDDCLVHMKNETKKESPSVQSAPETASEKLSEDVAPKKMTLHSSDAEKQSTDPCVKLDLNNNHDTKCLKEDEKTRKASVSELILLDDIPQPSRAAEVQVGISPISQNSNTTMLSEVLSLVDACSSSDAPEPPVRVLLEKSNSRTSASGNKHEEILKLYSTTAKACMSDQVGNNPYRDPSYINQCDVSESAAKLKGSQVSDSVAEQTSNEEQHNGVDGDSKLLPSQNIPGERIDNSLNNTVHNIRTYSDEESSQIISEVSGSNWVPNLRHSTSVESFDGSTVSEVEGESLVDRLKRQVEYDRKCLSALHMELEEERNAAAVAANQAMAMITRLQEEKAALHMEALQYLRMMDEQAEYDVDALEKANDLLADKEKEIQDLEAELEYYRSKFPDESMEEIMSKCSFNPKKTSITSINEDAKISGNLKIPMDTNGNYKPSFINVSWPGIEDEKLYISEYLRRLERELGEFANHGPGYAENGGSHLGEVVHDDESQINEKMEENHFSSQKDNGKYQIFRVENSNLIYNDQKDSTCGKDHKLLEFENKISEIKDRIEALKADCQFLESSFNTLENGKEGLRFVQEMAHQLQELRNLGLQRRGQSVS